MRTIPYATTTALIFLAACSAKIIDAGSNHPQGPADAAGADVNPPNDDPCAPVRQEAMSILQMSCSVCHSGAQPISGITGFDILNVDRLVRTSAVGPYYAQQCWRYLVPGDPERSLIDVRIENGTMPYPMVGGILTGQYSVPTPNQRSVLRNWITNCLGPDPSAAEDASPIAYDASYCE